LNNVDFTTPLVHCGDYAPEEPEVVSDGDDYSDDDEDSSEKGQVGDVEELCNQDIGTVKKDVTHKIQELGMKSESDPTPKNSGNAHSLMSSCLDDVAVGLWQDTSCLLSNPSSLSTLTLGGGIARAVVGGNFGIVLALLLAIFTLGLSIPFGACVGSDVRLGAGTVAGGKIGAASSNLMHAQGVPKSGEFLVIGPRIVEVECSVPQDRGVCNISEVVLRKAN